MGTVHLTAKHIRISRLHSWTSPEPISERSHLRKTIRAPPLPLRQESIPAKFYATRLSTVILVRKNGEVCFAERDVWQLAEGKPVLAQPLSTRVFHFKLDNGP